MTTMRIGILGAGAAGIATAKTLHERGFDVRVFEARSDVGGVWANDYHGLKLQKPRACYAFPDWPWPPDAPEFPSAPEVQRYLRGYLQHFGLEDRIHTNTRVQGLHRRSEGGWRVETEGPDGAESHEVDFFVVAPGMFNVAHTATWPGQEDFAGQVLHSSDYEGPDQVGGKDVVVVGFGRSALSIACDLVAHAKSVTLVHRDVRWGIPEKVAGLIPTHWLFYARWPVWFAPLNSRPSFGAKLCHALRLDKVFWGFFEWLLTVQYGLKRSKLVPERPIVRDVFSNLYVTPAAFPSLLRSGKIRAIKGSVARFGEHEVELEGAQTLPADLVIAATGWRQEYPYLPEPIRDQLHADDGLYLYRHMLHPAFPDAAFVGLVQGLNSPACYAMQAEWLARTLCGDLVLPTEHAQLEEIDATRTWIRNAVEPGPNRAHIINLHQTSYVDDLLRDMGEPRRRKAPVLDTLLPYTASDYRGAVAGKSAP